MIILKDHYDMCSWVFAIMYTQQIIHINSFKQTILTVFILILSQIFREHPLIFI